MRLNCNLDQVLVQLFLYREGHSAQDLEALSKFIIGQLRTEELRQCLVGKKTSAYITVLATCTCSSSSSDMHLHVRVHKR